MSCVSFGASVPFTRLARQAQLRPARFLWQQLMFFSLGATISQTIGEWCTEILQIRIDARETSGGQV